MSYIIFDDQDPEVLTHLRVLFCECEVRIRNHDDLSVRAKTDPITYSALYLGDAPRYSGAYVYIFDKQRFTVASYNDMYFREDVRPRLDRIVGRFEFPNRSGALPCLWRSVQ